MISGSEYYRFSTLNQRQPDTGYPRPLSTWGSSLTTIDAAFQFDRQKTYFFVDDQYYRFNDTSLQVSLSIQRHVATGKLIYSTTRRYR